MTWTISIKGRVQGVGFRPFVWRAALDRNLKGWVANGLEGVRIKINGTHQQATDFQDYILNNPPAMARIESTSLAADAHDAFFDNFSIQDSNQEGLPVLHLTPDAALCPDCRKDILTPNDRRYGYAFTTCTVCGPRYSILTGLPYDRPLTTMQGFVLCDTCRQEYGDPTNRRYYAQTNSCPQCGILLRLVDCRKGNAEIIADQAQILQQVQAAWQMGDIVAIKGTGGFLLTCDAGNPRAIATLRARKHRPSKPFALMYPDVATLQRDAVLHKAALQQLQSPEAPIVLLDRLLPSSSGLDHEGVAPGLHKIGAMLPNAPLFELLLCGFGKPIVATSANISNAPLVYEDETALRTLPGIADYILTHNRAIVMPQDDSVVAVRADQETGENTWAPLVVIRRARGLAPTHLQTDLPVPGNTALALGAELKSTFTLVQHGIVNTSQYLGDLTDFDAQERFHAVLQHLTGLYKAQASMVISDLHPGYFTTQLGHNLAKQGQIPFIQVQHHKAHFAAVLAENNLFVGKEPVLGVIWDGTGYGDDGQIWGGEFLLHAPQKGPDFTRCAHFGYFPVLLGDKMSREPRLSALAACAGFAEAAALLQHKFTPTEWALYQKLLARTDLLKTSSMGRIFDAVASLLGLADQVSYEGEAALLLEQMARTYCKQHGYAFGPDYFEITVRPGSPLMLHTDNLFHQLVAEIKSGKAQNYLAAKFHFSLIKAIEQIASLLKTQKIAFSGGVFQNTLLLDMAQQVLSPAYELYGHRQLSPNDENISFGQWAYVHRDKF